jgi:hypothetical protein
MLTVVLIVFLAIAIPSAILAPSWVNTAQTSFEQRSQAEDRADQGRISMSILVPSQIAPWLVNRIHTMINATGPLEWREVSFRTGPCSVHNLEQLPPGIFADAVAESCVRLDAIQQQYSVNCSRAVTCDVPEVARQQLIQVRTDLYDVFEKAGLVLPYIADEQNAGP